MMSLALVPGRASRRNTGTLARTVVTDTGVAGGRQHRVKGTCSRAATAAPVDELVHVLQGDCSSPAASAAAIEAERCRSGTTENDAVRAFG